MNYTSIAHCERANYQIDYHGGSRQSVIDRFYEWCEKNGAIWAYLYEEETAEKVATFNRNAFRV